MKKNTKYKIFIFAIVIIILVLSNQVISFGFSVSDIDGDTTTVDTQKITNTTNNIVKVIAAVGAIVSVIVLMILGIKYMIGSVEEKAEYKKTMMPYIIGTTILFAASTIASVIFNFASSIYKYSIIILN